MKAFRNLLGILVKETKIQEKLLTLLSEERTKIVHLEREQIEKLTEKKDILLTELQDLKLERVGYFQAIRELFNLDKTTIKLSEIAQYCEDVDLKEKLLKVGGNLKELAQKVQELNKDNGILLKQSLGLLSSAISIMTAKPQASNSSYGRNKKVASEDEKDLSLVSSFNKSA